MTPNQQRSYGITQNLLNKPIPRFYGAGKHKVELAYITPDEANLLADMDLHGSNPPNPGPGGIPNYNDPGTGMSGVAASAAEAAASGASVGTADAAQMGHEGMTGFATHGGGTVTGGGGTVGYGPGPDADPSHFSNQVGMYGPQVSPVSYSGIPMQRPEQPERSFNFGLPSLGLPSVDKLSEFSTDVNKFAFNPMLGIVSGLTGFPIGMVLGLANAFGMDIGPVAPEDPSQTRGRDVLTAENELDAENKRQAELQATLDATSNLTAAQLEKLKGLITMGYPEDYALQVAQLT